MAKSYFAVVTLLAPTDGVSDGVPTHPIAPGGPPPVVGGGPVYPPGVWPNPPDGSVGIPGFPTPPMAPGGPPPVVGGGPIYPPPGVGHPGFPTPPIAPGGPPPGIWPPVVWPDPPAGGGGGGSVMPPIYYPPSIWPNPPGEGAKPPSIWPNPDDPAHPIAPGGAGMYVLVYLPGVGWKYVEIDVGAKPEHPISPTPQPKV